MPRTLRRWPHRAAALLIALATCAPGVAHAAEPAIATSLTLSAPATCAYGAHVAVVATLEDTSGVPIAHVPVSVMRVRGSAETTLVTRTTDESGRVRTTIAPKSRVVLRARFLGTDLLGASKSARVAVAPRVKLSKPWTHDSFAVPNQWLPARGTLLPKHSKSSKATIILCERREHGGWILHETFSAKIVNSKRASHYLGKFRLPDTGTWRVRIRHDDAGHAMTTSLGTHISVTRWRDRYVGRKIGNFKTSRKLVAITIDDGPNQRTLKICSILERYGGRGTFFFVDQLLKRGYEKQAKAVYDRGHEVANHTAHHMPLTGSYSADLSEATPTKARLTKATGFAPVWIRGMGGGVDATGLQVVAATHQLYCNWSVDSYDSHQRYTAPDIIYHNVVDHVHPGSVVLIHQTHPESVAALPRICQTLRRRGYKLVTLSQLASVSTHY